MNLNNLEKDWDNSSYKCNKCRDLTFIINDGVATPCECRAVKEDKDILRKSGISEEFRNKNFENFKTINDSQSINAYNKAREYSNSFHIIKNNTQNSIMFMGQPGSGKTHLSLSIANVLMDKGVGVVYMGYRDVITQIKQNIMDEVYYNKVMNRYKNAKVLLIDDLFKGSISKSDINIMFELINHMYFNKLPVIVSTVNKYKVLAFILSGAFLGVMAILTISYGSSMVAVTGMASMSRNFVPTMGCFFGLAFKKYGMPLQAIVIGEFVINIIFFGFIALGAPTAIQDVITGLALLIIITLTTKVTKGEIVK